LAELTLSCQAATPAQLAGCKGDFIHLFLWEQGKFIHDKRLVTHDRFAFLTRLRGKVRGQSADAVTLWMPPYTGSGELGSALRYSGFSNQADQHTMLTGVNEERRR